MLRPADTELVKVVHIDSAGQDKGNIVLVIDGKNKFFRSTRNVVFYGIDERALLSKLWPDKPPEIRTTKLK